MQLEERPKAFLRTALGNISVYKGEEFYWTYANPVIDRCREQFYPDSNDNDRVHNAIINYAKRHYTRRFNRWFAPG